jgi:hypothetical protein
VPDNGNNFPTHYLFFISLPPFFHQTSFNFPSAVRGKSCCSLALSPYFIILLKVSYKKSLFFQQNKAALGLLDKHFLCLQVKQMWDWVTSQDTIQIF